MRSHFALIRNSHPLYIQLFTVMKQAGDETCLSLHRSADRWRGRQELRTDLVELRDQQLRRELADTAVILFGNVFDRQLSLGGHVRQPCHQCQSEMLKRVSLVGRGAPAGRAAASCSGTFVLWPACSVPVPVISLVGN